MGTQQAAGRLCSGTLFKEHDGSWRCAEGLVREPCSSSFTNTTEVMDGIGARCMQVCRQRHCGLAGVRQQHRSSARGYLSCRRQAGTHTYCSWIMSVVQAGCAAYAADSSIWLLPDAKQFAMAVPHACQGLALISYSTCPLFAVLPRCRCARPGCWIVETPATCRGCHAHRRPRCCALWRR